MSDSPAPPPPLVEFPQKGSLGLNHCGGASIPRIPVKKGWGRSGWERHTFRIRGIPKPNGAGPRAVWPLHLVGHPWSSERPFEGIGPIGWQRPLVVRGRGLSVESEGMGARLVLRGRSKGSQRSNSVFPAETPRASFVVQEFRVTNIIFFVLKNIFP